MPSSATESNNFSIGLQSVPEIKKRISLPVSGTVPAYLCETTLYRVGPGRYDVEHSDGKPYKINHWFDGLSLLHSFHIDSATNTVEYQSVFIAKEKVSTIEKTSSGRWNGFSFGTMDPCRSLFGRFFQLMTSAPVNPDTGRPPKPNIGVTLQTIPGKGLCVRSDISFNHVLNEEALDIEEFFGFNQLDAELKGLMSAAHGHLDSKTGEYFNYVYSLAGSGRVDYSIFKVKDSGETEVLAKIQENACYIHSIIATDKYVILMVWPMVLNPLKVAWCRSILDGSTFRDDLDTVFYVISRENGGVVAKYSSPPFFCFHHVNAFEEGDDVVIDISKYEDSSVVHEFKLDNLRSATKISPSQLSRFTLKDVSNCNEGEKQVAIETVLHDKDFEFPIIHSGFKQRKYKFAYGATTDGIGLMNAICKVNIETGDRIVWTGEDIVVGEPIFVPDPEGTDEDDGCLLVVVLHAKEKRSSLVILNSKNLSEIAGADVPQIVPLGFHGLAKKKEVEAEEL